MATMNWTFVRNCHGKDRYLSSRGLEITRLPITETLVIAAARQGLGLVVKTVALPQDHAHAGRLLDRAGQP